MEMVRISQMSDLHGHKLNVLQDRVRYSYHVPRNRSDHVPGRY